VTFFSETQCIYINSSKTRISIVMSALQIGYIPVGFLLYE